jgi:hypothetical protein
MAVVIGRLTVEVLQLCGWRTLLGLLQGQVYRQLTRLAVDSSVSIRLHLMMHLMGLSSAGFTL